MPVKKRFDYEVIPHTSRESKALSRPESVSSVAVSNSVILVDTESGLRRVSFSVVPKEKTLQGTSGNAEIIGRPLAMEAGHRLLKRIFRGRSSPPSSLEIGIVQPAANESAEPELAVKEQAKITLGDEDYAFMGDGQRMTVDGEHLKAVEFAKEYPDIFPLVNQGPGQEISDNAAVRAGEFLEIPRESNLEEAA
ncbi:MAG TPA: hypothetical protein VFW77_04340 [Candidatus Saccharimonadales bacterium]|nr:hypothetical protein [Candidatus Saccharimonadales bacterium]